MEPGKPFPIDSFVTDLAEVKPAKETPLKIPSFSLPIGFHTLSLFFIASYYDGNATAFFKHFVFEDKSERFNNLDKVDFTKSLDTIVNFIFDDQRPERVLRGLSDRRCDITRMAMLKAIGTEEYVTNEVPRGAEDGILEYLREASDVSRRYLFLVNAIPFYDINAFAITTTAGQPMFMNSIIRKEYPTIDSVTVKRDKIPETVNSLAVGQFQVDWAIVSVKGCISLVLLRPPTYVRISDAVTTFVENPFEDATIHMICYRHHSFIHGRKYVIANSSDDACVFHNPSIPGDEIWCRIMRAKLEKWQQRMPLFVKYVSKCVEFPALYLTSIGYSDDISFASAIFIDYSANIEAATSICQKYILGSAQYASVKVPVAEYARFCFWVRSFVRVLKAISLGDLKSIEVHLLSVFRSLPAKNHFLVANSILLCTECLRIFHSQRGKNEELYISILRIFRFVLGEQFSAVVGLQKSDIPRPLRNQIVNVENCAKLFHGMPFRKDKQSPAPVLLRLRKYFEQCIARGLDIPTEVPEFTLDPAYIAFLKLQKFDVCIEI